MRAALRTDRDVLSGTTQGSASVNAPVAISVVEYGGRRAIVVVGVMLAALLQTLDATIVNVALPIVEGNIGASIDDGTWIVTGYIILNVIAIPLAPYLMIRLGRRAYYATCIIGFTVASFFCGTATSLATLVAFRVVQGAFGGGLIAMSQIILRDTFPATKLGTSSALFAMALTIGPALGPTLGGWLTDAWSWQWVFFINIVPGAIAAGIVLGTVRNPLPPRKIPFDAIGLALLALALGSFQFVLDEGERHDWFEDATITGFAIAAAASLVAFVTWESMGTTTPIVDLRIFRHRNVRAAVPAAVLMGTIIFGPTVILPQYVQRVLGFTATLSGLLVLTRAIPVLILTPLIARLATRCDTRLILTFGFLTSSACFVVLASRMSVASDFGSLAAVIAVSGFGQVALLVPLLTALFSTVPLADAAKSSSFISLSVQLGGSIASTALVTILDRRQYLHADVLRSSVTLRALAASPSAHHAGLATMARLVSEQAANAGFADAVTSLAPIALAALLPVWFLVPRRTT